MSVRDAFGHWQNDHFVVTHRGIHAGASIGCNEADLLFPNGTRDRESYRGIEEAYGLLRGRNQKQAKSCWSSS